MVSISFIIGFNKSTLLYLVVTLWRSDIWQRQTLSYNVCFIYFCPFYVLVSVSLVPQYHEIAGLTLYIALLFVDLSVDTRPSLRLCYRSGSRKCTTRSATTRTPKVGTLPCPSSSCHSKRWVIGFSLIFGGNVNGHLLVTFEFCCMFYGLFCLM